MKQKFRMTYDLVTEESACHGDAAYKGFLPRSGNVPRRNNMPAKPALFTLRQAVDLLQDLPGRQGPIEADSCPVTSPRWLTATGRERESFTQGNGDCVSLSLHLVDVSPSSAYRIARLLRCHGIKSAQTVA
jgi:hypothetical protein